MSVYVSSIKYCATCAFWGGPREVVRDGSSVSTNCCDKGMCNHPTRKGISYDATHICHEWSTWSALHWRSFVLDEAYL